jgi:hypothetical protein
VLRDAEKKTIGFVLWSQLTKFITAIPGHHSFVGRRILEAAIATQIGWRTITGYERPLFLNSTSRGRIRLTQGVALILRALIQVVHAQHWLSTDTNSDASHCCAACCPGIRVIADAAEPGSGVTGTLW